MKNKRDQSQEKPADNGPIDELGEKEAWYARFAAARFAAGLPVVAKLVDWDKLPSVTDDDEEPGARRVEAEPIDDENPRGRDLHRLRDWWRWKRPDLAEIVSRVVADGQPRLCRFEEDGRIVPEDGEPITADSTANAGTIGDQSSLADYFRGRGVPEEKLLDRLDDFAGRAVEALVFLRMSADAYDCRCDNPGPDDEDRENAVIVPDWVTHASDCPAFVATYVSRFLETEGIEHPAPPSFEDPTSEELRQEFRRSAAAWDRLAEKLDIPADGDAATSANAIKEAAESGRALLEALGDIDLEALRERERRNRRLEELKLQEAALEKAMSRQCMQSSTLARSRALYGGSPTDAAAHWLLENELWSRMGLLPRFEVRARRPKTRPGWRRPAVGTCEKCGKPEELGAYRDIDGWSLTVACPDACDPDDVLWPFVDYAVNGAQLRALGFKIY